MYLTSRRLSHIDEIQKATGEAVAFYLFRIWRSIGRLWYNKLLIYSVHEES